MKTVSDIVAKTPVEEIMHDPERHKKWDTENMSFLQVGLSLKEDNSSNLDQLIWKKTDVFGDWKTIDDLVIVEKESLAKKRMENALKILTYSCTQCGLLLDWKTEHATGTNLNRCEVRIQHISMGVVKDSPDTTLALRDACILALEKLYHSQSVVRMKLRQEDIDGAINTGDLMAEVLNWYSDSAKYVNYLSGLDYKDHLASKIPRFINWLKRKGIPTDHMRFLKYDERRFLRGSLCGRGHRRGRNHDTKGTRRGRISNDIPENVSSDLRDQYSGVDEQAGQYENVVDQSASDVEMKSGGSPLLVHADQEVDVNFYEDSNFELFDEPMVENETVMVKGDAEVGEVARSDESKCKPVEVLIYENDSAEAEVEIKDEVCNDVIAVEVIMARHDDVNAVEYIEERGNDVNAVEHIEERGNDVNAVEHIEERGNDVNAVEHIEEKGNDVNAVMLKRKIPRFIKWWKKKGIPTDQMRFLKYDKRRFMRGSFHVRGHRRGRNHDTKGKRRGRNSNDIPENVSSDFRDQYSGMNEQAGQSENVVDQSTSDVEMKSGGSPLFVHADQEVDVNFYEDSNFELFDEPMVENETVMVKGDAEVGEVARSDESKCKPVEVLIYENDSAEAEVEIKDEACNDVIAVEVIMARHDDVNSVEYIEERGNDVNAVEHIEERGNDVNAVEHIEERGNDVNAVEHIEERGNDVNAVKVLEEVSDDVIALGHIKKERDDVNAVKVLEEGHDNVNAGEHFEEGRDDVNAVESLNSKCVEIKEEGVINKHLVDTANNVDTEMKSEVLTCMQVFAGPGLMPETDLLKLDVDVEGSVVNTGSTSGLFETPEEIQRREERGQKSNVPSSVALTDVTSRTTANCTSSPDKIVSAGQQEQQTMVSKPLVVSANTFEIKASVASSPDEIISADHQGQQTMVSNHLTILVDTSEIKASFGSSPNNIVIVDQQDEHTMPSNSLALAVNTFDIPASSVSGTETVPSGCHPKEQTKGSESIGGREAILSLQARERSTAINSYLKIFLMPQLSIGHCNWLVFGPDLLDYEVNYISKAARQVDAEIDRETHEGKEYVLVYFKKDWKQIVDILVESQNKKYGQFSLIDAADLPVDFLS